MLGFLKQLLARYGQDEVANRAASLSYYMIFSLGPLLFVVLGVIGLVVRHEGARSRLLDNLSGVIGPQATQAISGTLSSQGLGSKTGLAFWVGGIGLVLGAIGIFGQLQKALNGLLHVEPGPGAGRKPLIRQKLISLVLVATICLLLLASVVTSTFISSLGGSHGARHFLFFIIDILSSVIILSLMMMMLYRFLPAVKIAWAVLAKASVIVAVLFTIGKLVLGIIIGRNGTISAYGAAGSLIALLLWIFYSGQIFYLGAVGINLYLDNHPSKMTPRYSGDDAVLRVSINKVSMNKDRLDVLIEKFLAGLGRGWRS